MSAVERPRPGVERVTPALTVEDLDRLAAACVESVCATAICVRLGRAARSARRRTDSAPGDEHGPEHGRGDRPPGTLRPGSCRRRSLGVFAKATLVDELGSI